MGNPVYVRNVFKNKKNLLNWIMDSLMITYVYQC